MSDTPTSASRRSTYRHGDLRNALLDAGIALARMGGPGAVVLREATRQAGVVPNAAYRHFASREDLLLAVRAYALSQVARAMEVELAKLHPSVGPLRYARDSVRAVGTGYLRFAHAEPGLFKTAFSSHEQVEADPDAAKAGASGMNPFELLSMALDRLAAAGGLPPERRPGAEYLAWSAVHGLALLVSEGPLHGLPEATREVIGQRLLDMVEQGL
ncbi:TetR/AcrR family transcriptional regulator [Chitinolyticbacter meiyuanensis]|uniref:TetR/AcrR family transcriptional regulator n=1 Tax=Chitinolyticbacter meiyuanensis TaxID=682798 RepID=UPI0011E5BEC0|nr:TetR/AcrR family transcriptional regulator [Chitinolyticbacter meiyuanensis]